MEKIIETTHSINIWIPVIAALIGVFVAGILNLITTLIFERRRHKIESQTLRLALVAEIYGIVAIIDARNYQEGLQSTRNWMINNKSQHLSFKINMPENYCPIFNANAGKIGLLKPDEAAFIVGFHQIIMSIVQDVTPGGVLYEGGDAEQFAEASALLEHAVAMGNKLTDKIKIPTDLIFYKLHYSLLSKTTCESN